MLQDHAHDAPGFCRQAHEARRVRARGQVHDQCILREDSAPPGLENGSCERYAAGPHIMRVRCAGCRCQIESLIQGSLVDPIDEDPRHIEAHIRPPSLPNDLSCLRQFPIELNRFRTIMPARCAGYDETIEPKPPSHRGRFDPPRITLPWGGVTALLNTSTSKRPAAAR